ncbi:MAG: tetratricopeptide repeat protein [Nocardioidaceae bacterium]
MSHIPDDQLALSYELAKMSFEQRNYAAAAGRLVELLEVEPGNVGARLLLARSYFHSAQLAKAEVTLRDVLDRDPTEAYAHLMLGRVLQRQSRHDEARSSLRMAAVMNPAYADDTGGLPRPEEPQH